MQTDSTPKNPIVYLNGELCPFDKAAISPDDQGFLTGHGIFETLIAYAGAPFATAEHHTRLVIGAQRMGLDAPTLTEFAEILEMVVKANHLEGVPKSRLRMTLTKGNNNRQTLLATGQSVTLEIQPASVITVPFARNEKGALTGIKTLNYGENAVAIKLAKEKGADEAIFGNTQGNLCEGTWSNIFVVYKGELITPPLASGCLPGVTREIVICAGKDAGIVITEADLLLSDLYDCEAAFLTSSIREIQPICSVDGTNFSCPSDSVEELKLAFQAKRASILGSS